MSQAGVGTMREETLRAVAKRTMTLPCSPAWASWGEVWGTPLVSPSLPPSVLKERKQRYHVTWTLVQLRADGLPNWLEGGDLFLLDRACGLGWSPRDLPRSCLSCSVFPACVTKEELRATLPSIASGCTPGPSAHKKHDSTRSKEQ